MGNGAASPLSGGWVYWRSVHRLEMREAIYLVWAVGIVTLFLALFLSFFLSLSLALSFFLVSLFLFTAKHPPIALRWDME